MFDVQAVVEPTTGQLWIVAEDGHGQHEYFYLVNDDGSTDRIRTYVENGRTVLYKSHFQKFETRDQINVKQAGEIADAIGIIFFGFATSAATIVAAEGAVTTYGTKAIGDLIVNEVKDEIKDQLVEAVEEAIGIPLPGLPDKSDLKKLGRRGGQKRLKEIAKDDKIGGSTKAWLNQEVNEVRRGKKKHLRNPPGTELKHRKGKDAKDGHSYEHSDLQIKELHKTETRLQRKSKSKG